jgi:hypothetical protein
MMIDKINTSFGNFVLLSTAKVQICGRLLSGGNNIYALLPDTFHTDTDYLRAVLLI